MFKLFSHFNIELILYVFLLYTIFMINKLFFISPIKLPSDIDFLVSNSGCRHFYVYYDKFLNNNFEYIKEFILKAHNLNSYIYVNFKHDINDNDIKDIKKFINYLKKTDIDGVFINSYSILEIIKNKKYPFEIIIDSYFDIHNLWGVDFVNTFYKADKIILTEEIYMKNIEKIKKYSKASLAIDADNLPWCISDIKASGNIDSVVIKGKFSSEKDILNSILFLENLINNPEGFNFKIKKLPFKHIRKSYYQTNHFSGQIISSEGEDFKFSKNIRPFHWEFKTSKLRSKINYSTLPLNKINLKLSSLDQIANLHKFINRVGFNPVYSIEYGEIVSTFDLAKKSFNDIINYVKNFCFKNNIKLQLSTPRILIERDFDRVFEYVKLLCLNPPYPDSVVINNIGYFYAFINDADLKDINIEIGDGINILNSLSISCLSELHSLLAVNLDSFKDMNNLKLCLSKVNKIVKNKKYTIAGNIRIPTLGLCPLNNDSAIVSRLSCKAPCHRGSFAINDPYLDKRFPFVVDGFCRMHMYRDQILENYQDIGILEKIGINEFIIDLSTLNGKFVSSFLTKYLNYKYKIESKLK